MSGDTVDLSNASFGKAPQAKVEYAMIVSWANCKLNKAKDGLYLSAGVKIVSPGESLGFGLQFPPFAFMIAKKGDPGKTAEYLSQTVPLLATMLDKDPEYVQANLPSRAGATTAVTQELVGTMFLAQAVYDPPKTLPDGKEIQGRWNVDPRSVRLPDFDINELLGAGDGPGLDEMFSFDEAAEAF